MNQQLMDQIMMQNMVFHSHVGVHEQEKKDGQSFELDVVFYCRRLQAAQTDRLDQTIDYGQAYRRIERIVTAARYDLIERLAGVVADDLLEAFPLACRVSVTVRKPQAPVHGVFDSMAVQICRERDVCV